MGQAGGVLNDGGGVPGRIHLVVQRRNSCALIVISGIAATVAVAHVCAAEDRAEGDLSVGDIEMQFVATPLMLVPFGRLPDPDRSGGR